MKPTRVRIELGGLIVYGEYEPATEDSGPRGEPPDTPGTPEIFEVDAVFLDIGPSLPEEAIRGIQREVLEKIRVENRARKMGNN